MQWHLTLEKLLLLKIPFFVHFFPPLKKLYLEPYCNCKNWSSIPAVIACWLISSGQVACCNFWFPGKAVRIVFWLTCIFRVKRNKLNKKLPFSRFNEIISPTVFWTRRVCKIVILKPIIYEETSTYALLKDIAEIMIRNVVLQ